MWNEAIKLPHVRLCAHDPVQDPHISRIIINHHWYGGFGENLFMLSAGHSAGTPLTAADAATLRGALATGKTFSSVAEAVRLLDIPPLKQPTQAGCSRERPVHLDLGGNIGMFVVWAAASGCEVIAVEPLTMNAARLWHTLQANNWTSNVLLYKNAVSSDLRIVEIDVQVSTHGQSSISRADARRNGRIGSLNDFVNATAKTELVTTLIVADLFDGGVGRPRHPFLDRAIAPGDLASIKVDIETWDLVALWGLRRVIEVGLPPLIKVEFGGLFGNVHGCTGHQFLRWLYAIGYLTYTPGLHRPLTLLDWEETLFRGEKLPRTEYEELLKSRGIPMVTELYVVHSSAPVPDMLQVIGPGGRTPI